MTDNKHDEAVEVTQADRDLESWFLRRMTGSCWEGPVARLLARHRLAALDTRPDVEAMREQCARVAEYPVGDMTNPAWRPGTPSEIATAIRSIRSIPVPTSGDACE